MQPDPRERSIAWSGDRFVNLTPTNLAFQGRFLHSAFRFLVERNDREPPVPMPVVAPRWDAPATGLRVTWLGHSTVMVEVGGRRVLTDPMWSERASPVSGIGPRRFHPPPVPLLALPDPDVVVLSHDHYDHLDTPTIRALATRSCRFVAPLGVGALLRDAGVSADRITELDWWETATVADDLRIVACPARHFSGRSARRRNPTLWAAFALLGRDHRIFFGGDGGLDDVFTEIGARFGPFDLAMLEIGASDPAWVDIHLGPVNAIEACRRLGATPPAHPLGHLQPRPPPLVRPPRAPVPGRGGRRPTRGPAADRGGLRTRIAADPPVVAGGPRVPERGVAGTPSRR